MVDKPSKPEDEYFKKLDEEKKRKLREKIEKEKEEMRKKYEKEAHWMKCPKCGSDLKEVVYRGVLVDKCTSCEGIWLDRGEIEILAGEGSGFVNSLLNFLRRK